MDRVVRTCKVYRIVRGIEGLELDDLDLTGLDITTAEAGNAASWRDRNTAFELPNDRNEGRTGLA